MNHRQGANRDPLDHLATWLSHHHDDARDAHGAPLDDAMSDEEMAALTEQVIQRGHAARGLRRRRKRRIIAAVAAAATLAVGGAVAALVLTRDQPTNPQAGITCRPSATNDPTGIVIGPASDPVGACRRLWDQGRFEAFGISDQPEALVACISPTGTIDVYPGDPETCQRLSLTPASPQPSPGVDTLLELQERLIADINQIDCLNSTQAAHQARQILDDLDLDDWDITVTPDATNAPCVKAGFEAETSHIVIHAA